MIVRIIIFVVFFFSEHACISLYLKQFEHVALVLYVKTLVFTCG